MTRSDVPGSAGGGVDPLAPIVVTLVHGTFASGAPWTKEGSALRDEIAAALAAEPGGIAFDVFEWSGRNSHKARVKAGYELAAHIRELQRRMPACRHFIVAHSHGGNVALLAHKHLDVAEHALGIATLGTPFLHARLRGDLAFQTLRSLEREAVEENQLAAAMFAFALTIATVALLGNTLEGRVANPWWWAFAVALVVGYAARPLFQRFVTPHLVRLLFRFSGKRAAMRLATAIAFPALPSTHILSFVYPRDEAGLLLDTLELTTKAPTRIMEWVFGIGLLVLAPMLFIAPYASVANVVAGDFFGFDAERIADLAIKAFMALYLGFVGLWLVVLAVRYVLSLLRGHPAGFGWERPSLHSWAEIGATASAEVPAARSNVAETVPYKAEAVSAGLRHSGLYEDRRILKALAFWMGHVR